MKKYPSTATRRFNPVRTRLARLKRKSPSASTIIFPTNLIVDFKNVEWSAHPFSKSTSLQLILDQAGRAIASAPLNHLASSIHGLERMNSNLISAPSNLTIGTGWPKGDHYETYWLGPIEEIIPLCDLTDSETEKITLQTRQLGSSGRLVYAIAKSSLKSFKANQPTEPGTLDFSGLISSKINFVPNLLKTIERCRVTDIRLIYAAYEPESITTAVAHLAKLLPGKLLPTTLTPTNNLLNKNDCYFSTSTWANRKLTDSSGPGAILLGAGNLPQIIAKIQNS
ncbi:MAG: hypothetical protein ABI397_00240 [Candidatus Saccharimonas sp.]